MAKVLKELQFETPNKTGVLGKVSDALKKAGVNMEQAWACGEGSRGHFGIVTNNNAKAKKALQKIGVRKFSEKEVLMVAMPNRVGALSRIAAKLAKAHIAVTCLSATSAGRNRVAVLLGTKNNKKARRVI